MLDQYAVMGNPISHSKSPFIHSLFANQTQQKLEYIPLHVDVDGFVEAVKTFSDNNGKGLNITVPFKQSAWEIVNERSARAEKAGAINTITIQQGNHLVGDNTDGIGLVRDLQTNLDLSMCDKKILVLGAGGAVRGVLGPILEQKPKSVVVVNRTESKALELEKLFKNDGPIRGVSYDNLEETPFDLVINGTAASLGGEVPSISVENVKHACCYDMMYSKDDTVFMAWAKQNKAKEVWDGLGMLVEQAAESFYIWRGVRPDTEYVIQQVRESF